MRFGVMAAAAACVMAVPAEAAVTVITFEPGTPTTAELPDGRRKSFIDGQNSIVPVNGGNALLATSTGFAKDTVFYYGTSSGPSLPRTTRYSLQISSFDIFSAEGAELFSTVGGRQVLEAGRAYTISLPQTDSLDFIASVSVRGTALIDNVIAISGYTVVPEPATWALMIFGFGAVGGALRRRPARRAAAA